MREARLAGCVRLNELNEELERREALRAMDGDEAATDAAEERAPASDAARRPTVVDEGVAPERFQCGGSFQSRKAKGSFCNGPIRKTHLGKLSTGSYP